MFAYVLEIASKPGAKGSVCGVAPLQKFSEKADGGRDEEALVTAFFLNEKKPRLLDQWLDKIVRASGSEAVFFSIIAALLIWALLGIRFGHSENWQVIISDVQAIFSYAFDSLLVRQQMNMYDREMMVAAQMQSRIRSNVRMLSKAQEQLSQEQQAALSALCNKEFIVEREEEKLLPSEGAFGLFITAVSHVLGHISVVGLFWVAVFVWIGIGPLFQFSDSWQLYMNSASSAWMVLYFAFLANIRERHIAHDMKCLDSLFTIDSSLEAHLRAMTDDKESNPEVMLSAPKVNKLQRAIFYYADFVGTLVGIAILLTVMITWLATGPVFGFSSNWWLFIGTYAGMIGMHDGFVLRNMQARLASYVDKEMNVLHQIDRNLFDRMGLTFPDSHAERQLTISERVSVVVDQVSAHELTVLSGVLTIIGLLVGASVMGWTLTGQLLCNVPPSIIESFLMMILVTGHNLNDDRKRLELQTLYERRMRLLRYARHLTPFRAQLAVALESKELPVEVTVAPSTPSDN